MEQAIMAIASLSATKTPGESDLKITRLDVYKLKLPYKNPVSFSRVVEDSGEYVLLRIVADNGQEGIAESVCRPQHTGEDATLVAYQIQTFFAPLVPTANSTRLTAARESGDISCDGRSLQADLVRCGRPVPVPRCVAR
jgi:hypothetical protein